MDDIFDRLVNPTVIATMILSGVAYGWYLWSLDIRPTVRLYSTSVFPGLVFLIVIWSVRGFQGTLSMVYVALIIDWLIFAHAGYAAVIVRRRWYGRAK